MAADTDKFQRTQQPERKAGPVDELSRQELLKVVDEVHEKALSSGIAEASKLAHERSVDQALALEELDELQIAEEMKGRVVTQYFYEFPSRGATITGLSYAGVKAIARELAARGEAITIEDVKIERFVEQDGADVVTCLARSKNLRTGEVRFGIASQALAMNTREGKRPDPFAATKALNKAQRNAIRQFIPEVVINEMYRAWKDGPKA